MEEGNGGGEHAYMRPHALGPQLHEFYHKRRRFLSILQLFFVPSVGGGTSEGFVKRGIRGRGIDYRNQY